jgi:hypothetical protein
MRLTHWSLSPSVWIGATATCGDGSGRRVDGSSAVQGGPLQRHLPGVERLTRTVFNSPVGRVSPGEFRMISGKFSI